MSEKIENDSFLDGEWCAATLGEFISILVDGGDPAVKFRVTHDSEPDSDGKFIRELEVVILPEGQVGENIFDCDRIHTTLWMMLEKGVLK